MQEWLNKQNINTLSLDARLYLHSLGKDFKQLKLEESFKAAGLDAFNRIDGHPFEVEQFLILRKIVLTQPNASDEQKQTVLDDLAQRCKLISYLGKAQRTDLSHKESAYIDRKLRFEWLFHLVESDLEKLDLKNIDLDQFKFRFVNQLYLQNQLSQVDVVTFLFAQQLLGIDDIQQLKVYFKEHWMLGDHRLSLGTGLFSEKDPCLANGAQVQQTLHPAPEPVSGDSSIESYVDSMFGDETTIYVVDNEGKKTKYSTESDYKPKEGDKVHYHRQMAIDYIEKIVAHMSKEFSDAFTRFEQVFKAMAPDQKSVIIHQLLEGSPLGAVDTSHWIRIVVQKCCLLQNRLFAEPWVNGM